jgi:hypothetical protein
MIVLEPIHILYLTATLFYYTRYLSDNRRYMMFCSAVCAYTGSFYFWYLGFDTAAIAAFVTGTAGAVQGIFPPHTLERTRVLRFCIALLLVCIGAYFSASNAIEVLPLIATASSRLFEVQSCPQRIKMGGIPSNLCWLYYNVVNGLYLNLIVDSINLVLNLASICWFKIKRQRQALAYA